MWKPETKTFREVIEEKKSQIDAIPEETLIKLKESFFQQFSKLTEILGGKKSKLLAAGMNDLKDTNDHELFMQILEKEDITDLLNDPERPQFAFIISQLAQQLKAIIIEQSILDPDAYKGTINYMIDQLLKNRIITYERLKEIMDSDSKISDKDIKTDTDDDEIRKEILIWLEDLSEDIDSSIRRTVIPETPERPPMTLRSLPPPPHNDNSDIEHQPTLSIPIQAPHQFTETQPSPEYNEDGTPKQPSDPTPIPALSPSDSVRESVISMGDDVISLAPDAIISEPPQKGESRESIFNEEGLHPIFNRPTTLPPPREIIAIDGLQVEYADGEDLQNLEIFRRNCLVIEKTHVSGRVSETIPALVSTITIGGDITNLIDLKDFPEDTIALREDSIATEEEVGKYAVRKFMTEIHFQSDGQIKVKYIDGEVTPLTGDIPEENPFPIKLEDKLHVGHYLITVHRRHYTKKRFVEHSKKIIRQLAQVIFDVRTTEWEDDMRAHNAIVQIIDDFKIDSPEKQEVMKYCREAYVKGKHTHQERMQNWNPRNPTCDSKVIEQLLLLLHMKKQDHDMIEDLDYTRLHLTQEADRRIQTYFDLARKAFGIKAETMVGLGRRLSKFGPSSDNIVKRRRDIIKYRFELIKFIELGMLKINDVEKNTPKPFHKDIPAILEMRKYIQELAVEPTDEEIIGAIHGCQNIILGDFFTNEELTRIGLKTNKKYNGLAPDHNEEVREDPDPVRKTRLPQLRPSTLSDYAQALGTMYAMKYMGNIQSDIATMNYSNLQENEKHIDFIQGLIDTGIITPAMVVRSNKKKEIATKFVAESLQKARDIIAEINQPK